MPFTISLSTGRPRRNPGPPVIFVLFVRIGDRALISSWSSARLFCIISSCSWQAEGGIEKIQWFSRMNSKNSASNGAFRSVLFEPNIMSFFLARVKVTFILRQSFISSPICILIKPSFILFTDNVLDPKYSTELKISICSPCPSLGFDLQLEFRPVYGA